MKHYATTWLLAWAMAWIAPPTLKAQENDLLLHYDFTTVSGTNVGDRSPSDITAKLVNNAKVEQMGKYYVLNLGKSNGYLDMTAKAGTVFKAVDDYTISTYYLVDKNASLNGNGYFLWAFSTQAACGSGDGKYSAYRLNAQRYATSTGGYSNESGIQIGSASAKGQWIHVAYTEKEGVGTLYINGEAIGTLTSMPRNKTNYGTASVPYCWLGRAPFSGDNYLQQTLVADFRLYGRSLSEDEVRILAAGCEQLEYEYYHGNPGDATALNAAIKEAQEALAQADVYLPGAVADLEDMVLQAQGMVSNGNYSQVAYDEMLTQLKNAITTMRATAGLSFDYTQATDAYDTERGFIHPGGLHTQADFDRIKRQLAEGNPKVTTAYNILKNAEYAQPSIATWPVETIVRGGTGQNYINAARGATMAYQNALRWKIEGNRDCAAGAVRILMQWANTCKLVSGDSNWALAAGLYGYQFAQAAELVRDYEGWSKSQFEKFKQWMLTVWYPGNIHFLRARNGTWENYVGNQGGIRPGHYWSNWPLCNVLAVLSIGILCDDVFIYNQGLSFMKYDQVGTFKNPRTANPILNDGCTEFIGNFVVTTQKSNLETGAYGELGQMNESGRDGGHSSMALGLAVDICKTAWNQGDDLFSYMNNRMAAGIEFQAACTQNVQGLPWTNYKYVDCRTAWHNGWLMEGPAEPAEVRPYWATVIGHYEGVKGVRMPFSEKAYEQMGIDAGGMGSASGGYDHLGYSVLTNTYDEQLASADKVPTLLSPRMEYDGKVIEHNELGGLTNTYVVTKTNALPTGKTVRLMPQLPKGAEDTGLWQWNTGETTKDITISTDKSFIYRVTYTNQHGIESQQAFSIAVAGDCAPTPSVNTTISYNGSTYTNVDSITVFYGETVTLGISGVGGYETYLWDNGKTTSSITTSPIVRGRDFTVAYIGQGGARTLRTFHVGVKYTRPDFSVNGITYKDSVKVLAEPGDKVVIGPYVPETLPGVSYQWSDGCQGRTITIDDAKESGTYTLDMTVNGQAMQYVYMVFVKDTTEALLPTGNYIIRHVYTDTYMTNMGLKKLIGFTPLEGEAGSDVQQWFVNDPAENGQYDIRSLTDSSYVSLAYVTYATNTRAPMRLAHAAGSNYYSIYTRSGRYLLVDDDLTVSYADNKGLTDYPFEFIPMKDVPQGIIPPHADGVSAKTEWFTPSGIKMTNGQAGLVIERKTYPDGRITISKIRR